MFTFNFFLSTKRSNETGEAPIYVRITLHNKKVDRSTGIYVDPKYYDRCTKRVLGKTKIAAEQNQQLIEIQSKLGELSAQKKPDTTQLMLIEKILKNSSEPASIDNLKLVIDYYLGSLKERINNNLQDSIIPATYKKNSFMAQTISGYLEKVNLVNLPASALDRNLIIEFMQWCRDTCKFSVSHTNRLVKFIRSALRFGITEGYCQPGSGLFVKLKNESKPIFYLNPDQLEIIKSMNLCGHKLERIRDLFLIQCYTGLSYSDLAHVSKKCIYHDMEGNLFFKYQRKKSGKVAKLPLINEAQSLLNKYQYQLPVISNQKYNQNLKLLGILANFDFPLTTHVGRKTCGTIFLNAGLSIYTVKTILGHGSVKTTEAYYAELNESGMMNEFRKINGAFSVATNSIPEGQYRLFS